MAVKTCVGIKAQGALVLAAGHQHGLVAVLVPDMRQGCMQQRSAIAALPVVGMGDDVLDQGIVPAAAREVGDDQQHTAADQLRADKAAQVPIAGIRHQALPDGLNLRLRRAGIVCRVQMGVQREQRGQVGIDQGADGERGWGWRHGGRSQKGEGHQLIRP